MARGTTGTREDRDGATLRAVRQPDAVRGPAAGALAVRGLPGQPAARRDPAGEAAARLGSAGRGRARLPRLRLDERRAQRGFVRATGLSRVNCSVLGTPNTEQLTLDEVLF